MFKYATSSHKKIDIYHIINIKNINFAFRICFFFLSTKHENRSKSMIYVDLNTFDVWTYFLLKINRAHAIIVSFIKIKNNRMFVRMLKLFVMLFIHSIVFNDFIFMFWNIEIFVVVVLLKKKIDVFIVKLDIVEQFHKFWCNCIWSCDH